MNLKGYVVKDAAGNRFAFTANHYLQPGDLVKLRGGNGTEVEVERLEGAEGKVAGRCDSAVQYIETARATIAKHG